MASRIHPFHRPDPATCRIFTWVLVLSMVSTVPSSLLAAGLFSKKSDRKEAPAKPAPKPKVRPFQAIFSPKPKAPLRAIPVEPTPATPTSTPNAPGFSGRLTSVERTRPDQIRIFVLGDSQGLLPFGEVLQKELVGRDYEVLFHAVKNGTPYFWHGRWPSPVLTRLYTPAASVEQSGKWREVSMRPCSIAEYVEVYDPDIFIFQAGTNFEQDLASSSPAGIVAQIDNSLQQASSRGAKVLWIGPPDARDDVRSVDFQERAYATLRTALAGISEAQGYDCFFDSRPVCPIPNGTGGDGEHPTNAAGRLWGTAAAGWIGEVIEHWRCDDALRPAGGSPSTPVTRLLTQQLEQSTPPRALTAELELVAKSDPGDIKTFSYTDAFSVFQYRVRNASEILPQLGEMGVATDPAKGEATVYVLHWAVHNSGSGPRATKVASRRVGETYKMQFCPLNEHPLGEPLATMTQFNDFDDLLAPVFLATNFLEERSL